MVITDKLQSSHLEGRIALVHRKQMTVWRRKPRHLSLPTFDQNSLPDYQAGSASVVECQHSFVYVNSSTAPARRYNILCLGDHHQVRLDRQSFGASRGLRLWSVPPLRPEDSNAWVFFFLARVRCAISNSALLSALSHWKYVYYREKGAWASTIGMRERAWCVQSLLQQSRNNHQRTLLIMILADSVLTEWEDLKCTTIHVSYIYLYANREGHVITQLHL